MKRYATYLGNGNDTFCWFRRRANELTKEYVVKRLWDE